jgi:hypothetical protein
MDNSMEGMQHHYLPIVSSSAGPVPVQAMRWIFMSGWNDCSWVWTLLLAH